MSRRDPRALLLVILTLIAFVLLGGFLMAEVGRSYPGFFVAPDYRGDMGLRELKGIERPVRLFRLPGEGV